jgi:arylformamidase
MRIYDISQPLTNETPVWPGDAPVRLTFTAEQARGDTVTVGRVDMGMHNGTHVDAPYHFRADGARVEQYEIERFVGQCAVIAIYPIPPFEITAERIRAGWERLGAPQEAARRILFRTRKTRGQGWSDTFAYPTPDAVRYLADLGCRLVGLDSPSYDPMSSKTLDAHHALAEAGIANLENLVLDDVPEWLYTLAALPLAVVGMDAAPVRAVLIEGRLVP